MGRLGQRMASLALALLAVTATGCTSIEREEKEAEKEEKALEKKAEPFLNVCKDEVKKICPAAGNDKAKQSSCLKANKNKAGVNCRNAIEKEMKEKNK